MSLLAKIGIPRIIFWDFDGVIKDSVDIKTNAFIKLFSSYGPEVMQKVRIHHEANGGMSRFKKIPIYLNFAGEIVDELKVTGLCEKYGKLVFEKVIDSAWVKGAKEYLEQNIYSQKFYLISATPTEELKNIIHEIGIIKHFSAIYGAPVIKTDAIKLILQNQKVLPSQTVMIGDAQVDLDAAFANDVPFILRKHSSNEILVASFKGHIINDITEL